MLFLSFRRVAKSGFLGFLRNGWLTTATVMVMVLVLLVLGGLIFVGALSSTLLTSFESKIDIAVYFVPEATEEGVFQVKREVELQPDVAEVTYVSRDAALTAFRERHKGNALIVEALDELGENPLEASINIQAKDPAQYGAISDFLLKKNYPIVDKINYFENQEVIDRLGAVVGTVRGTGVILAAFLALVSILVAFNTIRLAIYTLREEIGIMRLVGATQWFIRGPFLMEGILYGLSAALVTTFLFFPLNWLISPKLAVLVPDFNLFSYFLSNLFEFFLVMAVAGIGLGVISSFIAMRRYLTI